MPKFISNITMANNSKVTGLPAPSDSSDAATKAYVDSKAAPVTSVNTKTGAVVLSAADIAVADTAEHFTNTNVETVLAELKQFANSGKNSIAGVIGSPASSSDTFAQLAGYITNAKTRLYTYLSKIPTVESAVISEGTLDYFLDNIETTRSFRQKTRLRQSSGSTYAITNVGTTTAKLCVTPYILINDGATTPATVDFNNADATNFIFDNDKVDFDGVMRLKTLSSSVTDNNPVDSVQSYVFNLANTSDFRITNVSNNQISFETMPSGQTVFASGFIDTQNVGDISSVSLSTNISGGGIIKVAVSFEYFDLDLPTPENTTWRAWDGSSWISLSHTQIQNGMSPSTLNSLTAANLDSERGNFLSSVNHFEKTKLRFAYYIEEPTFAAVAEVDKLTVNFNLKGTFTPVTGAYTSAVSYTFNETSQTLTFTFGSTDTYQINYISTS